MTESTVSPVAAYVPAPQEHAAPRPPLVRTGRRIGADAVLRTLTQVAALTIIAMLAALIAVLAHAALPSIKAFGAGFLVSSEWRPNELQVPKRGPDGNVIIEEGETVTETLAPAFGALPVIYGTTVSSLIALVLAVPLSLGAALFLIRISPKRISGPISFLIEFLAAIPSIAYGIWGLFVLAPYLQRYIEPTSRWLYDRLPAMDWIGILCLLALVAIGVTGLVFTQRFAVRQKTAGRWLACLALPVLFIVLSCGFIRSINNAVDRMMPSAEAAVERVLGHSPTLAWLFEEKLDIGGETVIRPIPLVGRDMLSGGIVLAIMIVPIITAISRDVLKSVPRAQLEGTVALGATWWQSSREMLRYSRSGLFGAVMLGLARAAGETMAITMVIGNNNQIRASLFAPAQTMSSLLANEFAEASTEIHRASLTEVGLILLVMSLAFNVLARYLVVGKNARSASAH